jgi:apolipoprotein N-acyltransferase
METMTQEKNDNKKKSKNLSYLWLLLATVLFFFSNGKWILPITSWLAPLFLVRFIRERKPFPALLIGLLMVNIISVFTWRGMIPAGGLVYYLIIFTLFSIFYIPFIFDRLLHTKIRGFKSTLILPLAAASFEYLYSILLPWGSWCTMGYTQSQDIYLLQLLSITGLWGITFLIYWFASTINWAWENRFDWGKIKNGLLCYAAVIILVLSYGAIRLTFFPPAAPTVRTASIGRPDTEASGTYEKYVSDIASSYNPSQFKVTDEHIDGFLRESIKGIHDGLFERSLLEVRAGAKIVFWSENGAPAMKNDSQGVISEEHITSRGKAFAVNQKVYLGMSLQVIYNPEVLLDNKFVLIAPTGEIVFEYFKAHPIFPSESSVTRTRSKELPMAETPYGKLSVVICHDMDFHNLLQQAGDAGVDILFDPSYDWQAIDPYHTYMAKFRAVEQGFSMIRHTYGGLSMATDYYGNVLAVMDHYTKEAGTGSHMVSYVPTKGVTTLYSLIGDLFAWLCIAALLILTVTSFRRSGKDL